MTEQELADRFWRDLDDVSSRSEPPDTSEAGGTHQQDLEFARFLLAQDFGSAQANLRVRLRRQLLRGWQREAMLPEGRVAVSGRVLATYRGLGFAALTIIAALIVALAWPAVPRAVAQGINSLRQAIGVGPNTTVEQVPTIAPVGPCGSEPAIRGPWLERIDPALMWCIDTPITKWGGNVAPGTDNTVLRFERVEDAKSLLPFTPRVPDYLPNGYRLKGVAVPPNRDGIAEFYAGTRGEMVVLQQMVGRESPDASGASDTQTVQQLRGVVVRTGTDKAVRGVMLNGLPAAWIEDGGLWWESSGISYAVGGTGIGLDEASRIAGSLK